MSWNQNKIFHHLALKKNIKKKPMKIQNKEITIKFEDFLKSISDEHNNEKMKSKIQTFNWVLLMIKWKDLRRNETHTKQKKLLKW